MPSNETSSPYLLLGGVVHVGLKYWGSIGLRRRSSQGASRAPAVDSVGGHASRGRHRRYATGGQVRNEGLGP
eukprot:7595682-Pyramimonas_sp.AAC.1